MAILFLLLACNGKVSPDLTDTGETDGGGAPSPLTVRITQPATGSWFPEGTAVELRVEVQDISGLPASAELTWTGNPAGLDAAPDQTEEDGSATLSLPALAAGLYSVGVQAQAADGGVGVATVGFQVVDVDGDNDGYADQAWGGTDCDDGDPTIHPNAIEFCDGQDNDCDGTVDGEAAVDAPTWYPDLDLDGFGVSDEAVVACQQPKDHVQRGGDCDDGDGSVNPGAAEICDGRDNDCNDLVDDEDPGLFSGTGTLWFPDEDGDGFGAFSPYALSCKAPAGHVDQGGDCDDGDPAIHPDAVEVCDGIDNNCLDGADEPGAADGASWYLDADGDTWGDSAEVLIACDRPSGYVATEGDCQDADPAIHPDAQEICNDGVDNDCDGLWEGCLGDTLTQGYRLTGESALDEAGYAAQVLGDLDGDGQVDLLVGARSQDAGATDAGRGYLLLGPIEADASLGSAFATFDGPSAEGRVGRALAGGADATGDGRGDLLFGAPSTTGTRTQAGAVYLVDGETALSGGATSLADAWHAFTGVNNFDYVGIGLAMADLDGDAAADLLIGATGLDAGGSNAGGVYLLKGPIGAGTTALTSGAWDARILGARASDELGAVIEAGTDLDGDGLPELIFGVRKDSTAASSAGAVCLLLLPPSGSISLADADLCLLGSSEGDLLGSALARVPDLDGDGRDELAVGAPGSDDLGLSAGAAWLFSGRADLSALHGRELAGLASVSLRGASTGLQLGQSLAADGDHDGDGQLDLLVGAPGGGPTGTGAALLFLGPLPATLLSDEADATWAGDTTTGGLGQLVLFGGALVPGASGTLLLGARAADLSGTDAGALVLLPTTGL